MSVVPEEKLPAPDWASLWDTLKGADRRAAYTALWHLRRAPGKAVALLDRHLRPVPATDLGRVERLLRDLEAPAFAVREQATQELRRLADAGPVADRLRDLADQFCDGTASPLVLALVEGTRFTPAEIQQLRQLLDQLEAPEQGKKRPGKR